MTRKKYGFRVAGFILKILGGLLIIGIIAFLGWRIIDRNIVPSQVKDITPNQKLCDAYKIYGDDLTIYYQDQTDYSREEKNYGYFANSGTLIIDEAEQIQFVLRYNNSTLKYTAEDYSYYEVTDKSGNVQTFPFKEKKKALEAAKAIDPDNPEKYMEYFITPLSRDEEAYDVTITVMYDLTPDNLEDNDGSDKSAVRYERFQPTGDAIKHQKTLYNYRKFIFDGIKIDDSVLAVMVDVYYVGDLDYNEDPLATLLIYFYEDKNANIEYKLSSAEKNALKNYSK